MRPKLWQAYAPIGLTLTACFYQPTGVAQPVDTGSADDATTLAPTTAADPTTTGSSGDAPGCGDGVVQAGEDCDDGDGNGDDRACTRACANARCGDGKLHAGVETCDDGNLIDDDACTNTCIPGACGDGIVGPGEACDHALGNADTAACTSTCRLAACGDGLVHTGVEDCDDGNLDDTDACLSTCVVASCGDELVHAGVEDCDDGNLVDTDACIACKTATCGDGIVRASVEACDDGNAVNHDTCGNACQRPRRVFVTSTIYNGNLGGLAGADEKCQSLAMPLGIKANFKAWLSDASAGPADRLDTSFTGSYQLLDGTVIASDGWADLIDGALQNPIERSETEELVGAQVWTDTSTGGIAPLGKHCNGWNASVNTLSATTGYSGFKDAKWTEYETVSCNNLHHLYCFEDP